MLSLKRRLMKFICEPRLLSQHFMLVFSIPLQCLTLNLKSFVTLNLNNMKTVTMAIQNSKTKQQTVKNLVKKAMKKMPDFPPASRLSSTEPRWPPAAALVHFPNKILKCHRLHCLLFLFGTFCRLYSTNFGAIEEKRLSLLEVSALRMKKKKKHGRFHQLFPLSAMKCCYRVTSGQVLHIRTRVSTTEQGAIGLVLKLLLAKSNESLFVFICHGEFVRYA